MLGLLKVSSDNQNRKANVKWFAEPRWLDCILCLIKKILFLGDPFWDMLNEESDGWLPSRTKLEFALKCLEIVQVQRNFTH